jgi:hypothetical protein
MRCFALPQAGLQTEGQSLATIVFGPGGNAPGDGCACVLPMLLQDGCFPLGARKLTRIVSRRYALWRFLGFSATNRFGE